MKKKLIWAGVIFILVFVLPGFIFTWLGLSAGNPMANVEVGNGMSAKIACSARFVSGFEPARIRDDLASYTAAVDVLTVEIDDVAQRVTASLFGFAAVSAQYREGLGCTLEHGDTSALDKIVPPALPQSDAPWPAGSMVATLNDDTQAYLTSMLARDNDDGLNTRALVVVRDGQITAEAYGEGISPETLLLGWSMGKSLTGIMMGTLQQQGLLDVAEHSLFPEWQDERGNISIKNLLQMSSGLDFAEIYAPGSDATDMLFNAHSASAVARKQKLGKQPGEYFYYSSGTTNLLSQLYVERAGGLQSALETVVRDVYTPLGLQNTLIEPDPSGVFVGSSYVYATARDWARMALVMLNGGEINGQRVLSQEWVEASTQPNGSANDGRYGYQFWLNQGSDELRWPNLPADAYAMSGNRAQVVMTVPSESTIIVRLGWTQGRYPVDTNFKELLAYLAQS